MLAPAIHIPGLPKTPDPPKSLVELSESLKHPLVIRTGVTCDQSGQWALYVTVPKHVNIPIPDLEAKCLGFPVAYEAEPDEPIRAL
ncbi:MAG: hypothetical protein WCJ09_03220 [Planctomycetota bacterium]